MPDTRTPNAVRLDFGSDELDHANLSGAAFADASGDWLWLAGDESLGVYRLHRLAAVGSEALHYGEACSFPLAELLDLPGRPDEEPDLEGMAVADGYLWIVGSHGRKRKQPKDGKDDARNAERLAMVSLDGNRRLLARVPIEADGDGAPRLVRKAADGRRAGRLAGNAKSNLLTAELKDDPHLADFMAIPGKDNGFDIEGLARLPDQQGADRLLVGLRGPVLRGWTLLLEMSVEADGDDALRLAPLDDDGTLVRKHFLQLDGLGVRDLNFRGDDLYILAGPTMVLDGEIRVYHWPGAGPALGANRQPARFESGALREMVTVPHGRGCNRAEALCDLPPALKQQLAGTASRAGDWLVLYDAPGADRKDGAHTVFGDLLGGA